MMNNTTQDTYVRARIDAATKDRAVEALTDMGLSVSDAIRLLLIRVAEERRLPFVVKAPNKDTRAVAELDAGGGKVCSTVSELMENLQEDIQMDSEKKWFKENDTQVSLGKFQAFGVSIWSRYGNASELIEMLGFVRDVAWNGLEGILEEVFYDSKSCICTFEFAPGFELDDPRAEAILLSAKKHISQFIWRDFIEHSYAIDEMGE